MLTLQQASLESAAQRIARIITREYGLTVRVEGSDAYIDLQKRAIFIPDFTKAELEHLRGIIDGFLDHECAHGIFTDAAVVAAAEFKKGDPCHTVWNAIEDTWVERAMGARYIGCRDNLRLLNTVLKADLEKKYHTCDMFTRLLLTCMRIWQGELELADCIANPEFGALLVALRAEILEGKSVASTAEAIDLARRILAKIQQVSQQQTGGSSAGEGEGAEQEDNKGSGAGQGKDDSDTGVEEEANDNTNSSMDSDSDTDTDNDSDTDSETEPDTETKSGNETADTDTSEEAEGAGDEAEADTTAEGGKDTTLDSPEEAGQAQARELQEAIDAGDVQDRLDIEDLINQNLHELRDKDTGNDPDDYLVFTTEFDTDVTYSVEYRQSQGALYAKLKGQVQEYVGSMATRLGDALAAEVESRWVPGARRGRKFDRLALNRWFLDSDEDRLWKRVEQDRQWDTAVSLLWDCSGSMGSNRARNSKSALARLAAIAYHEALTRVGIAHEVLGFNTGGAVPAELENKVREAVEAGKDLSRFSRLATTDKRMVFVPFGSTDGRAICAIEGNSANRDGECVLWAAQRLAARPERRKVLIVGSDGLPSGALWGRTEKRYLQLVIRQIINAGIEVLALGIMNDSVKSYYPEWALVSSAADIPAVVLGQLSRVLLKGGTHGATSKFPELY